jgi:hypothetical protein
VDYQLRLAPLVRRHVETCEEWSGLVWLGGPAWAAEIRAAFGGDVPAVFAWYCFPALGVG